jgi:hypothetical protein
VDNLMDETADDTEPSTVTASSDTSTIPSFSTFTGSSFAAPQTAPEAEAPYVEPTSEPVAPETTPEPAPVEPVVTPMDEPVTDSAAVPVNDDLLSLKQQALAELGPLVDQLEQTPAERFRTTMMMIQSTDNQSLIPRAYEAAQAITDEKVRAQALLDVVNEINYFTQQKPAQQ